MSRQVLFQLQYELNRQQRLRPHLVLWLPYTPAIAFTLLLPLALVYLSLWLIPLAIMVLGVVWLAFKGFFIGLMDVITNPMRPLDIVIEENSLGCLTANERRWILLDGIVNFDQIYGDTWTIWHDSGIVVNIPASAISEEQVTLLRSAITEAKARARMDALPE